MLPSGHKHTHKKCFHTFRLDEKCDSLPVTTTLISKVLFFSPQQLYRKKPGMTMLCAKLPQNVSKNRYRDISPCTWLHTQLFFFISVGLCVQICANLNLLFLSSHSLSCPPVFLSFVPLSLPADDATRVILKSTDDYINANYINVSLCLLILLFRFFIFYQYLCVLLLWGVVGGRLC